MSERDRHEALGKLKQLAHEVRNALNGVSVNLEVARSRAARAGGGEGMGASGDPLQIAPFLETAMQQLDAATRLHKRYTDLATELATEPGESGLRAGETARPG